MGILDGIVEWIAEQVHEHSRSDAPLQSFGALGCSMDTFLRYFPAAETMYQVFLALGIGLILLNWVWQLFKNYFMGAGIEAEDPIKLSIRSFLFYLSHLLCERYCGSAPEDFRNTVQLDSDGRPAAFKICGF